MTASSLIAQDAEAKPISDNPIQDGVELQESPENKSNLENEEVKRRSKKHVAISEVEEEPSETCALRRCSDTSESAADQSVLSENFITMTGTITRGKKKGQNIDVVLNMSREELEVLETAILTKKTLKGKCKEDVGPHVVLWSAFCVPFTMLFSFFYSFYMGTLTWYNVFTLYSEEKPILIRILVSPLLILFYPFTIVLLSLGFGVYSSLVQISWCWESWVKEVSDLEKGFYAWLCNLLGLSDCCPYEVVILTGTDDKP